ncbi:hypothetical protein CDD83_10712 [Cordyceps sp. RAO-2017]|nr:hypothetical protein CDD83_10712 [Cordyceps sp. RAO-2017]
MSQASTRDATNSSPPPETADGAWLSASFSGASALSNEDFEYYSKYSSVMGPAGWHEPVRDEDMAIEVQRPSTDHVRQLNVTYDSIEAAALERSGPMQPSSAELRIPALCEDSPCPAQVACTKPRDGAVLAGGDAGARPRRLLDLATASRTGNEDAASLAAVRSRH